MTKKFLTVLLLVATLVAAVPVFADNVAINTLYDPESRLLSVSGTGYGSFMITVAKKKVNDEGLDVTISGLAVDNLPLIFKQIEASGTFSHTFTVPSAADEGKYNVYLNGLEGNASGSFIVIDIEEADDIIESLNEKKGLNDESGFKTILSASAETVGIDNEDSCYIENEEKIFEFLYKTKYSEISDFTTLYNKVYTLFRISNKEYEEILTIIDENSAKIDGVTAADISEDKRLGEEAKKLLFEKLSNGMFMEYIDKNGGFSFKNALEDMKALSAVQAAEYWSQLSEVVTQDFKNSFSSLLSYDKYNDVNDKDLVFEKMIGTEFGNMASVEKNFKEAVEQVYNEENKKEVQIQKPTPSTGGGASVTTPHFETEDTNNLPKAENQNVENNGFSDLNEKHWSFRAVSELCSMGVISGFPDGAFLPDKAVTRAELTKMIMTFADELSLGVAEEFSDVNKNDWYYTYVTNAAAKGIILGNNGMFSPNAMIKREDAAIIIYRVLSLRGEAPIAHKYFPDRNEISSYAKEAVGALGSIDIVKGNADGNFMPQSSLSRAEAAQLIYNAFVAGR